MPGGHPNARHAADTRADPVIAYAIEHGYLDSGEVFRVPMPDHDAANEGRLSVNRSCKRQNLSPGAWVDDQDGQQCNPLKSPCQDPDAPHFTSFKLWNKNGGRTHVFRQTGGDPAKLKYNPWMRKSPRYDDQGQRSGLCLYRGFLIRIKGRSDNVSSYPGPGKHQAAFDTIGCRNGHLIHSVRRILGTVNTHSRPLSIRYPSYDMAH